MALRFIRNTVVLFKPEASYGVDPVPTGAANAMLVSNLTINPFNATTEDRDLIRSFMGASESLIGSKFVEMSFDVELTGSGTVATAPPWAPTLLASAMAQTLTAIVRADYTPISSAFGSGFIHWYDDGLLHKAAGVRGTPVFALDINKRPVLRNKFIGLYSTPTVAANPTGTYTAWQVPQLISEANTLDLTFGGTHAIATAPLIVGGTTYPSQGIEVDLGNSVSFNPLLGGETVEMTDRKSTAKCTLDLTAAQEAAFIAIAEAGTLQTVGLSHGTVDNNKVLVWLQGVQITNVQKADANGKRMVSLDLRCLPSATGNDEVRIVTSF